MTLIPPTLALIPALVTLAVAFGRIVAPLAREARLATTVWLALRGTQPSERAEIIRALTGDAQEDLAGDGSASQPAAAQARRATERDKKLTTNGRR
jgi:hypothetical protein